MGTYFKVLFTIYIYIYYWPGQNIYLSQRSFVTTCPSLDVKAVTSGSRDQCCVSTSTSSVLSLFKISGNINAETLF